jgi:hypothetical protein
VPRSACQRAAHFVFDFPRELIGPEEIHRELAAGDDAEAEALERRLQNMDRIANGNGKVIEAKPIPQVETRPAMPRVADRRFRRI